MYDLSYCTFELGSWLGLIEEVYDGMVGVVDVFLAVLRLLVVLLVRVELPLDEVVRQVDWYCLILVQRVIGVIKPETQTSCNESIRINMNRKIVKSKIDV